MSLKSVNDIINLLVRQGKLQPPPIIRLLKVWPEVVGASIATYTRPVSIQRNVLWVATASAAWAQNLTFQRQAIVQKVNQSLETPVTDIRFSTAEWKRSSYQAKVKSTTILENHPSYTGNSEQSLPQPSLDQAHTTFARWAETVKERSQNLPLCPQCQCPTPPGELQRWGICSFCAAKHFAV